MRYSMTPLLPKIASSFFLGLVLLFAAPGGNICRAAQSQPAGVNEILLGFYEHPHLEVRITAMLRSMGIVDCAPLIAGMEKRLAVTGDPLEKSIISYVVASMTMKDEDIQRFLRDFIPSGAVSNALIYASLSGAPGYLEGLELYPLLLKLARDPRYRERAIVLLDHYAGEVREFSSLVTLSKKTYNRYAPQYQEAIDAFCKTLPYETPPYDFNHYYETFYLNPAPRIVHSAFDHLADSPDLATRVTAYHLISTPGLLGARLARKDLLPEERAILYLIMTFSGNWDKFIEYAPAFIDALPNTDEGAAKLVALEYSTYVWKGYCPDETEVQSLLSGLVHLQRSVLEQMGEEGKTALPLPLLRRANEKLHLLLGHAKPYIDQDEYAYFTSQADALRKEFDALAARLR